MEGPNSINKTISSPSGDYASVSFNPGDGNSGDYTLTAETSSDSSTIDITVDGNAPTITFPSREYVGEDPTITVEFSDQHTGVSSFSGSADNNVGISNTNGFNSCSAGNTCTVDFDLSTDELSSGDTFQLDVSAEDNVGNSDSKSKQFTFDNSYEGDDSPEFSIQNADESNNIVMEDSDQELEMTVTVDSGEQAPIGVKCFVGGDQVNEISYESFGSDDSQEFTCNIDGEDYSGGTHEVYVKVCDEAGNCVETDKRSYSFDASKPFISSFETAKSYNVFSESFKATFQAGDDASGIAEVEYFFDQSTLFGEGNPVQVSSGENFTIDTSGLSSGSHTVYLRVKDAAGRWSSSSSLSFEYYPNKRPKLNIQSPGNVTVTAGQSKTVDVTIRNPGQLFVESAKFTASAGDFLQVERDLSGLGAGDSAVVPVEINTKASNVGKYTLTLQTDKPQDTVSTTLLVEANQNQEQRVKSMLSNYTDKLEQLNQNISELRSGGLSEDLNETLSSNISDFVSEVQEAERFANQSDYYKALSALEGIDAKYEKASKTYSQVKKLDAINERNRMLKMIGVAVLILAVIVAVYVGRSGEYELDLSEYRIPEFGGVTEEVGEKIEGVKQKLEEEEEEAEQKFQGFS